MNHLPPLKRHTSPDGQIVGFNIHGPIPLPWNNFPSHLWYLIYLLPYSYFFSHTCYISVFLFLLIGILQAVISIYLPLRKVYEYQHTCEGCLEEGKHKKIDLEEMAKIIEGKTILCLCWQLLNPYVQLNYSSYLSIYKPSDICGNSTYSSFSLPLSHQNLYLSPLY